MATVKRLVPIPTVLHDVPYDVYARLRDSWRNDGLRMTYYDGTLEIMSPEFRHERGAEHLGMVIRAYGAVFDLAYQGAGSTTFRRGLPGGLRGKGKEPDAGFYFANTALIQGKTSLDLEVDPPPDLWVEVDNRGRSKGRLPLYASFGVPEVWRYRPRRRTLWFGLLEGGAYVESERSRSLPKLTPGIVLNLLDQGETRDNGTWDRWMRDWMDTTLRRAGP